MKEISSEILCCCVRVAPVTSRPTGASTVGFCEALLRFTPRLALRGEEAVFLDLSHWKQELPSSFETRLRWLARRFGLEVSQIAFGASARESWLRTLAPPSHEPITLLPELLDVFESESEVRKVAAKQVASLQSLGIHRLSHFTRLPARTLTSRFGKTGVRLLQALDALEKKAPESWPLFLPPERLEDTISLLDPETQTGIADTETLLIHVSRQGERLFSRLRGRNLRASLLALRLTLESRAVRDIALRLSTPQSQWGPVLSLLREKVVQVIEQKQPLDALLREATLQIEETAPGTGAQHDFFSREEREAEAQEALLLRLQEKLGKEAAFHAALVDTHWPEKSVTRAPAKLAPAAGTPEGLPPRPTRLLAEPIRLPENWRRRCTRLEGPERILPEWWETASHPPRDYYRIRNEHGQRLWIFVEAGADPAESPGWLQGWFD
jgi:protein ImuB